MKKNNKVLVVVIAVLAVLGWWLISEPKIEVLTLNKPAKLAGDYNVRILPPEKQDKIYSHVIIVSAPFFEKNYVTTFPQDAVTMSTSKNDVVARIYTDDPDVNRIKKYIQ